MSELGKALTITKIDKLGYTKAGGTSSPRDVLKRERKQATEWSKVSVTRN